MGKNMMAKIKTTDDRRKKYYISDKQLEKIKREVAEDVNCKSCLLCITIILSLSIFLLVKTICFLPGNNLGNE